MINSMNRSSSYLHLYTEYCMMYCTLMASSTNITPTIPQSKSIKSFIIEILHKIIRQTFTAIYKIETKKRLQKNKTYQVTKNSITYCNTVLTMHNPTYRHIVTTLPYI